jgi:formylglycine-generating enzyme required for sulfatase activity
MIALMACGGHGGSAIDATSDSPPAASCEGLAPTCGPAGTAPCCESSVVPGGTFYRGYDVGSDGMYTDMSAPATVSAFRLDTYEVTVARFRQFVNAGMGTQATAPAPGAGAHAHIPSSGWDASWNADLASNTATLEMFVKCEAAHQTWTDTPGANESLPINCITWYDAMAFCIWDGGYLPTEAEWNYAAAGGDEQRAYPWSSPPSSLVNDCSYANYFDLATGGFCAGGTSNGMMSGAVNRVGSESPMGDGRWGQADLGGNVWEWVLDGYATPYLAPCTDCASLDPAAPERVFRGGDFRNDAPSLRGATRDNYPPAVRQVDHGVRCARGA